MIRLSSAYNEESGESKKKRKLVCVTSWIVSKALELNPFSSEAFALAQCENSLI